MFPFQVVSARKAQRETREYILRGCTHVAVGWSWLEVLVLAVGWAKSGLGVTGPGCPAVGLSAAVWASLQHGGWIPRVSIKKEQGAYLQHFSDLALGVI